MRIIERSKLMKHGILLTVVAVSTIVNTSLHASWMKVYGEEGMTTIDCGYNVQQTTDGGYIVVGTRYVEPVSEDYDDYDLWLLKTDSLGDTVWTRTYDGGYGWVDEGRCVRQTKDGGYIITGFATLRNGSYASEDLWLLKTDEYGDTVWTKTHVGNPLWDYNDRGYWVEQTSDGGYIITGDREGGYLWVIKTDEYGDSIWAQAYDDNGNEIGFCVQEANGGGFLITGSWGGSAVTDASLWIDLSLIKMDPYGDTLWMRIYGGEWGDWGRSVQKTVEGGYIISGTTYLEGLGDEFWLLKIDSLGDTLWTRTYGGQEDERGYWAEQTTDGGYVIIGRTYSFGAGNWDAWLVKTDSVGDTLWTHTFGGDGVEEIFSGQQTSDGGYIFTGSTAYSYNNSVDLWLVKTDSLGYVGVEEEPILESVAGWELVTSLGSQIVLRYVDRSEGFHASVFDAIGRKVDELHSDGVSGTVTWGESMSPGVYFIRPTDESSGNNTARVVIIH
jgi:hypothetical protein